MSIRSPRKSSPASTGTPDFSIAGQPRTSSISRRIILTIIILAMLAVTIAVILALVFTPERRVTHRFEALVQDYYTNYYYDTVGTHDGTTATREEILAKYEQTGLATLTLRQLFYFDHDRHIDEKPFLETYCDLTSTTVRIYPQPPFGRTDYRADYHYSCDF